MPIKLNHGAPGSFKTASAVWYDVVEALRQGRKVITNVRDIADVGQFEEVLKENFEDSAEIIFIDTSTEQAKKAFGCFFHWAPFNSYILIDEAQYIYSKRLRVKPETFHLNPDLPIIPDEISLIDIDNSLDRPLEITTAFEKHRHYEWDFTLTTPNKKMVPDWILECIESCYLHKSKENVLPIPYFKRRINIRQHDPSSTGASLTSCTSSYSQKIPVKVHELYKSTESGKHTKNTASKSPVKVGWLVFFGFFGFITFYFMVSSATDLASSERFSGEPKQVEGANKVVSENGAIKNTDMVSVNKPVLLPNKNGGKNVRHVKKEKIKLPYSAFEIFVIGASKIGRKVSYIFILIIDKEKSIDLTSSDLKDMGYDIKPVSLKVALIRDLQDGKFLKVYSRPLRI